MSIFPVIEQTTSGRDSTAGTSHVITMPTDITAGELILVIFASSGNPGTINVSSSNMTWRYTTLWDESGDAYTFTCFIGYVTSTGTKTLTLSTSTSEETVHIVYRLSGVNQYDINGDGYLDVNGYFSTTSTSTLGTNANPPTDNAYTLYGEQDYLFIVAAITENTVATIAPTNFSGLTTIASINPNNVALSTAYRAYRTGSTYDPGSFTTAYDNWMALTISVLPILGCGSNYYRKHSGLHSLASNLKGYWKLDETTGTTLYDSTSTVNLFTSGTVNQTGKLGRAVSLSGVQYIMAGHTDSILTFPNGMTFSCWLNLTSAPAISNKIYNQYHETSPWTTISIGVTSSNKISGAVVNSLNEVFYFQTSTTINTSTWYNITFTCSEAGMRLYINGVEASYDWNDGFSGTIKQADGATFFGNEELNGDYCFVGLLDELAIFDKQLSPAEVSELYNSGSGKTYPL